MQGAACYQFSLVTSTSELLGCEMGVLVKAFGHLEIRGGFSDVERTRAAIVLSSLT